MSNRPRHASCSVVGCSHQRQHRSLHGLPAAEHRVVQWLNFIFDGHFPANVSKHLFVCAHHFTADSFRNLGQYQAGLAGKLHLIDGATPSIRDRDAAAAAGEMHISVVSSDRIPAFERCTTCCSQFHCPLCPKHLYKPSKPVRVRQHLVIHVKNAITFEDKKICRCNLTCRNGGHYHCPICDKTIMRRRDMETHLKSCAIQQESTSAAAQSNPSQESSFSPQPSPSASPSPDLLVQQSIQTSIIHSSANTQLSSSSPLISSSVETKKLKKVECPLCSVTCHLKNLAKHMQRKHPERSTDEEEQQAEVRPSDVDTPVEGGTSKAFLPSFNHVACQTDPPSRRTAATQLSIGTLGKHVRSKGTQTAASPPGVAMETASASSLSSTSERDQWYRPIKRPYLEEEEEETQEEEDEEEEAFTESPAEPHDSAFNPSHSEMFEPRTTFYRDDKYIVYESCLRQLFETCPVCKTECDIQRTSLGSYVEFTQICPLCQYSRRWQSQPLIGSDPAGNLQLSAATYFTGASFSKLEQLCKAMQLQICRYETFRRHVQTYLQPAVIHKWNTDQQKNFQLLQQRGGKVAVCGDMQTDSAGQSAKFGSYTLMHLESNTIMDLQLVQSSEVGGSHRMEKEGLKRCLDHLESSGLSVEYIVTDRRPQVQHFLKHRGITQFYDAWQFEKGLSEKLDKVAENKDCEVLKQWQPSIRDHIYWSATSSTSGPEKVAKWTSLVNHIQDVHVHNNPTFPQCAHPVKESKDPTNWLQPGSKVLHKVEKILTNNRVLRDVEKLSHHQTSSLQLFHTFIQHFAPRNLVFSFMGMLCRLYLAVMHYNENAAAAVCKMSESEKTREETQHTFSYVDELMKLLFDDSAPFVEELNKIHVPEHPTSPYETPSSAEEAAGCRGICSGNKIRSAD